MIIEVDPHISDPAFLFYAGNALSSRYVDLWAGAVVPFEENNIRAWVLQHAPGIEPYLASCSAWYVSHRSAQR
jgi:hypothetical protein